MDGDPWELVGRWQLRRRIRDRLVGAYGTVSGELVVAADGDGLRWDERGVLWWAGAERPVTRTYLLRPAADGWQVLLADGRPFHPWLPGQQVIHACRADVYTGLITADPGRVRTLWDIRGPRKDQRLVTRFHQVDGDGLEVPCDQGGRLPSADRVRQLRARSKRRSPRRPTVR